MNSKFKVGDVIVSKYPNHGGVERQIVAVRKTGYEWKYLYTDETWPSENSNDPFLTWWHKKENNDHL